MDESANLLLAQARARVGTVIRAKWRIDSLLGVGGMAAVYSATHRNGHRCAIKMLLPSSNSNPEIVRRFAKEGYVANNVNHRGVVTVLDDDIAEDGTCFLVMELLEGESFDSILRRPQRVDPSFVARLAHEVLDVLAAAHAQDIVHRDIKPENVFVLRDGGIKVLDFGIARARQLQANTNQTQNGGVMGTPGFMPPEQARGRWDEVDAQSDIWSIGAMMYVAVSRRPLRSAPTPNEELLLAMTEAPLPLHSVAPDVPLALADVIDRALAFDKKVRWPSAREMQRAIGAALGGRSEVVQASSAPTGVSLEAPPALASSRGTDAMLTATHSQPGSGDAAPSPSTSRGSGMRRILVATAVVASVAGGGIAIVRLLPIWNDRGNTVTPISGSGPAAGEQHVATQSNAPSATTNTGGTVLPSAAATPPTGPTTDSFSSPPPPPSTSATASPRVLGPKSQRSTKTRSKAGPADAPGFATTSPPAPPAAPPIAPPSTPTNFDPLKQRL